jgi:predicted RNA-binding protein YlqC (UPF0109 family)
MIKLLEYLIGNITGSSDFKVAETDEEGKTLLTVKADPNIIGLIIGKQGKTIKNLRKIVAIKAAIENKAVNITVTEK